MVEGKPAGSRRKRGRRSVKQSGTSSTPLAGAPAYITRRIPTYELLGEEGLAAIELHADRILKEVGIEIRGDEEALRLFREAGATVRGERVQLDEGMAAKKA